MRLPRAAAFALCLLAGVPVASRAGTFVETDFISHDQPIFFFGGYVSADAGGAHYHSYMALPVTASFLLPMASASEIVRAGDYALAVKGHMEPGYAWVGFEYTTGASLISSATHYEYGVTAVDVRARAADGAGWYAVAEFAGLAEPSRLIKVNASPAAFAWEIPGPAGVRDVAAKGAVVAATGVDGFGTSAYGTDGTLKWHAAVDGTRIAVAADGRVAVVSDAAADVTVTMFSPTGAVLWENTWSPTAGSLEQVAKVQFSVGGELYVAGVTVEGAFSDVFVTKYSAAGRAWELAWGAIDASESVAAFAFDAGTTENASAYLTGASVDASGSSRAYVLKIAREGVVLADHVTTWLGDSGGEAIRPRSSPTSVEIAGRAETTAADGTPMHGFFALFAEDVDGDGYTFGWSPGEDCDDLNAAVNPGATEITYDGLDNDCSSATRDDDLDFDGVRKAQDCNDLDATVRPGEVEIAFDGVDQNCNGMADDGTALAVASWVEGVPERISGVTVDAAGNVYVRTDSYNGTARLAKYDPNGTPLWSFGPGIAAALVLPSGASYVAQAQPSETGGYVVYVSRLDSEGAVTWQQVIGYSSYSSGSVVGMATDDAGRLRIQFGDWQGQQILGFDAAGAPLESIVLTGYPGRMLVDAPTGDIYMTSSVWGIVDRYGPDGVILGSFAAGKSPSIGLDSARGLIAFGSTLNTDARIQVFTTDGVPVWSATWTRADLPTATETPAFLAFDRDGNLVIAGSSGPLYTDELYLKYDPSGQLLWSVIHRSAFVGSNPGGLAIDEFGSIYTAGWAWNGSYSHLFALKLSPDGQILWFKLVQGDSEAAGMVLTPGLELVVAGEYRRYSTTGEYLAGGIIKYSQDLDLDGSVHQSDCDDFSAAIHPGAVEDPYDGVDQNCNGMVDEDADRDGWLGADDCNDSDPAIHPGAVEIPYDGVDQNCSGMADDDDLDRDGHPRATDCNDADPTIYVGAPEVKHDGVDQDCNGYDLTIEIVKAHYSVSSDDLRVEATSALMDQALLRVTGRGPMAWKPNQSQWTLNALPAGGSVPAVEVCGVEGCTSASVTLLE